MPNICDIKSMKVTDVALEEVDGQDFLKLTFDDYIEVYTKWEGCFTVVQQTRYYNPNYCFAKDLRKGC